MSDFNEDEEGEEDKRWPDDDELEERFTDGLKLQPPVPKDSTAWITLFDLPIWEELKPYAFIVLKWKSETSPEPEYNLEFRGVPFELSIRAIFTIVNCSDSTPKRPCGAWIHPIRARAAESLRATPGPGKKPSRLYYTGDCPVAPRRDGVKVKIRCCRTIIAGEHKKLAVLKFKHEFIKRHPPTPIFENGQWVLPALYR